MKLHCLLPVAFVVFPFLVMAQDSMRQTIVLEEVVVSEKLKSKKARVYKTHGHPAYDSFQEGEAHIFLLKGYPVGRVDYVEFFFNTGMPNMLRKTLHIRYRDVQVQLLLFGVKNDSLIGEPILPVDVVFTVGKDHDGAFRIPLSRFNIREEKLFIGIAIVGKTVKGEANIYVRMNEQKGAIVYTKHPGRFVGPGWLRDKYEPLIFKLKLGIVP